MSTRQKTVVAVLLILYLFPIWIYPLFPSQDGPSHLYNTVLFSDLLWNPRSFFAPFYEIHWHPFPNWLFTILALPMYPLLPIITVEKIILSLSLVGFVLAMFYFVRSISTEKTILGFSAFLFSYHWFLLMGFYNFCLAVPLALFAIGYCLRHRGAIRGRRLAFVMLVFVALYFSHIVPLAVALSVLALLFGCFGQKRIHALSQLVVSVIPASVLFLIHFLSQPRAREPAIHAPLVWLIANVFSFKVCPGFHWTESIWFIAVWIVLGYWVVQTWRQRGSQFSEDRPWWFIMAFLVALALLLPNNLLGGTALNERLSIFVGIFLLAALSVRAWTLPKSWLVAAFVVLATAQLVYLHVSFSLWNARLTKWQRVAAQIEPNRRVLPLIFEENVIGFYVNPWLHADCYVLLQTRSVSPTNYEGYQNYFPVIYRNNAPLSAPADWYRPDSYLERNMARFYDYVLLWHAGAAVLRHPALSGFREVWADGDLRLLKHR